MKIRLAISSDGPAISELYEDVFGKSMGVEDSIAHFRWDYQDNPGGQSYSHVIEGNGQLVAHWGVVPRRVWLKDHEVKACQTQDLMSNGRIFGVTALLARKIYPIIGQDGVELTYAFISHESADLHRKYLQWKLIPAPVLVRPLKVGKALRLVLARVRWLRPLKCFASLVFPVDLISRLQLRRSKNIRVRIEEISHFDEGADQLWERAKLSLGVSISRDACYLNWRYIHKPEDHYRIAAAKSEKQWRGYIVTKVEKRFGIQHGLIVDLLTIPTDVDTTHRLICHGIDTMRIEGAEIISALCLNGRPYYPTLLQHGFMPLPPRLFPQELYFGTRPVVLGSRLGSIINPFNWHITWGDNDDV